MTRRELIDLCLSYPGSYEDYPFDDFTNAGGDGTSWTVMRHRGNKKSFALIFERDGLCINLKCEPMRADFLRSALPGVMPAYHMNKERWVSLLLGSSADREQAEALLRLSYENTLGEPKAKRRKERV